MSSSSPSQLSLDALTKSTWAPNDLLPKFRAQCLQEIQRESNFVDLFDIRFSLQWNRVNHWALRLGTRSKIDRWRGWVFCQVSNSWNITWYPMTILVVHISSAYLYRCIWMLQNWTQSVGYHLLTQLSELHDYIDAEFVAWVIKRCCLAISAHDKVELSFCQSQVTSARLVRLLESLASHC